MSMQASRIREATRRRSSTVLSRTNGEKSITGRAPTAVRVIVPPLLKSANCATSSLVINPAMAFSSRRLCRSVEGLADLLRDRCRFHARRVVRMRRHPHPDLLSFDGELAAIRDPVGKLERLVVPLRDRGLDDDLVAEARWRHEPRFGLDERQARHAVFVVERIPAQADALEEQ